MGQIYSDREPDSDSERAAALREQCRLNDLCDLRGPEFLRLARLAHSEGLLDELIQRIGARRPQGAHRPLMSATSAHLEGPETQSSNRPSGDQGRPPDACKLRSEESLSQSDALASRIPLSVVDRQVDASAKKRLALAQQAFSALLSGRLTFVGARARARRERRYEGVVHHELHKLHAGRVNESRFAFDAIDGHWD